MIKRLDYLGTECKFYFDENETFRTKLGGVVTIILGVVMFVLIVFFGRDFYLRTNPLVIAEIGKYSYYPDYFLSNNNFTIVVGIETEGNDVIVDESQIYFEFNLFSYVFSEDGSIDYKLEPNPLVECNETHFSFSKESNAVRFQNYKCIDLNNLHVGGFWGSNSIYYINFTVNRCIKGELTKNGTKCSDQPRLDQQYYFSIYYQTYLVSPSDYENPLQ